MKLNVIFLILLLTVSCSDSTESARWNGYVIPSDSVLSYGNSKFSLIKTDQSSDIALVISLDYLSTKELAYTLDGLDNVNNHSYVEVLNSYYRNLGTPNLKKHESGFLIFSHKQSTTSWELVKKVEALSEDTLITPIASCTTLSLGSDCNFSIYADDYYLAFSLSNSDIKFAEKVIADINQQLKAWKK